MDPATGSTDVSITPTLTFLSAAASSYSIQFGTVNPPTEQIVLAIPAYTPPTLLNSTTYYWIACGINAISTTCSSVQSFTTIAVSGSAPSNLATSFPASGATDLSIVPTLSWTADNATSYVIRFGTSNPPTTETSLGAETTYAPGTLSYSTIYYWRILATNQFGTTTGDVWSFTTRADPGSTSFCARPCFRLFLTSAKVTELQTRRTANTAAWQAMTTYANTYIPDTITPKTTLSSSITAAQGVGSTFTVTDGSVFPSSGNFQVRIELEFFTVSRSVNTLTIVSRANIIYQYSMGAMAHASGVDIWRHVTLSGYCGYGAPILGMMMAAGESGLTTKARACFGQLVATYAGESVGSKYGYNAFRAAWFWIAVAYDWVRDSLTTAERELYAPVLQGAARFSIDNPKFCFGSCPPRQGQWEGSVTANIGGSQVRLGLAAGAAIAGDHADAQDLWNDSFAYYDAYVIPAMATGSFSGGISAEGSAYGQDNWHQVPEMLDIVASAIGSDEWARVAGWPTSFAKAVIYGIVPGAGRRSTSYVTTGTTTTGSTTITAGNATALEAGDYITLWLSGNYSWGDWGPLTTDATTPTDVLPTGYTPAATDVGGYLRFAPLAGGDGFDVGEYRVESIVSGKWRLNAAPAAVNKTTKWWKAPVFEYNTVVMSKSGNDLTVRDPAPWYANNGQIHRVTGMFTHGDVETYTNHMDFPFHDGNAGSGLSAVLNQLRTTDPTYAGYLKYIIDNALAASDQQALVWRFLYYDASVTAVDPAGASLPTIRATANSTATSLVVGRSDWTATATYSYFFNHADIGWGFDHAVHQMNDFGISRKRVWLSRGLHGYGATGLHYPPPHLNDCANNYGSAPYVGWRYNNTIAMNGCGTAIFSGINTAGPGTMTRQDVQTTHGYARGNAGDAYNWTGHTNPNVFQRDWLYVKPDLWAVMDYVTYQAASVSPTTWYFHHTGNPSESSQRITSTYSTQKLVQDVLLPTGAIFTEINHQDEDIFLRGYRMEVTSGVSTATEYLCSSFQAMDSGDTPAAVTTLTSTNACVFQVAAIASNPSCTATCVIGFVKGSTPTLTIEYTYTGTPTTHFLYGFAPSTDYHITRAGSTVTVIAATGLGDTTSSATGRLAVP
jgi:hypothetical protein